MTHHEALVKLEDMAVSHWIDRMYQVDWNWQSSIGRWVNLCDAVRRRIQRAKEMEAYDNASNQV